MRRRFPASVPGSPSMRIETAPALPTFEVRRVCNRVGYLQANWTSLASSTSYNLVVIGATFAIKCESILIVRLLLVLPAVR